MLIVPNREYISFIVGALDSAERSSPVFPTRIEFKILTAALLPIIYTPPPAVLAVLPAIVVFKMLTEAFSPIYTPPP